MKRYQFLRRFDIRCFTLCLIIENSFAQENQRETYLHDASISIIPIPRKGNVLCISTLD